MKTTMKRLAAYLLAMLLVLQILPVAADTSYSGIFTPGYVKYREILEITQEFETSILTVNMTSQLHATSGYTGITWSSDHPDIASVDENGLVTALTPGQVRITVEAEGYTDSITFRVVGETQTEKGKTESAEKMIIIINGQKTKTEYNGQIQTSTYTATSNDENFDETRLKLTEEGKTHLASGKNCGTYKDKLTADDFTYEGEDVEIVISNGWLKITPATVTVRLKGNIEKLWGQDDPDYSQYLEYEGLYGDDTIDVEVSREAGENAGYYQLTVNAGEQSNENYKFDFPDGLLVINIPQVKVRSSLEGVKSAPAGTEVTLTAVMEKLDSDRYHIQWQMGDTPDPSQMKDIEGANGVTYTYIFNEETVGKYFRVVISLP